MDKHERGRIAGIAHGIKARKQALERYYANPALCKKCGQIIKVKDGERPCMTKKKIFCDHSCAASFNNGPRTRYSPKKFCSRCGIEVCYKRKEGGKAKRKYCDECFSYMRVYGKRINSIDDKTKGELFSKCKNWQSARSAIRCHAARVFVLSGKKYSCEKCGYSLHIEVCHKKPVSDFPAETKIKEINDKENLVGFCETHHWEFDNGYLFFDSEGKLRNTLMVSEEPHKLPLKKELDGSNPSSAIK